MKAKSIFEEELKKAEDFLVNEIGNMDDKEDQREEEELEKTDDELRELKLKKKKNELKQLKKNDNSAL